MTGRRLAVIWIVAVAVTLAVTVGFNRLGGARIVSEVGALVDSGPKAVFIGSSLTRSAIPARSIKGDAPLGFAWQRFGVGGVGEDCLFLMARIAQEHGARTLFIEAAPILRRFYPSPPWPAAQILDVSERLRLNVRAVLMDRSCGSLDMQDEVPIESELHVLVRPGYGIWLRKPSRMPGWQRLANDLAARGDKLVILDFPRSETASDYLGAQSQSDLSQATRLFAERLGAPLFQPETVWEDRYFYDRAHLNALGRERYLRELAEWLSANA